MDKAATAVARSARVPVPTIVVSTPPSCDYSFPAQLEFDTTSHNHVASQRRGRFVIKLAATLFLAGQDDFDTPGKCAETMNFLWGHTRLAEEYLRRRQPTGVPRATYTSQQLKKAEGQWKAALGDRVLEADGFQRCWDELEPFFQRCVEEVRSREQQTSPPAPSKSAHRSAPETPAAVQGEVTAPRPQRVAAATTPTAPVQRQAALVSGDASVSSLRPSSLLPPGTSPTIAPTAVSLDLTKVPCRVLDVVYAAAVRFLRLATVARRTAYGPADAEEAALAACGWLPLPQLIDGVHADVGSDSALKVLWSWLAAIPVEEAVTVFLSLLMPLCRTGELQFLHSSASNSAGADPLSTITHVRAAWGHKDATVAAAVMQDHPLVPLQSLVKSESAASGWSGWCECVEDTKTLRKEVAEVGVHVYAAEQPYMVLIEETVVEEFSRPTGTSAAHPTGGAKEVSAAAAATAATAAETVLAALRKRTDAVPDKAPGSASSSAFGVASSAATSVSARELVQLLHPARPTSALLLAAAVAAMTFSASRLAFLPILAQFLANQSPAETGAEVALHLVRCPPSAPQPHCSLTGVAASASPRVVVVSPWRLSYGRQGLPTPPDPHSSSSSRAALPHAPSAFHIEALFGVGTIANTASQCLTLWRPPTELLVDLRIASLWNLWLWYGYRSCHSAKPSSRSATTAAGKLGRPGTCGAGPFMVATTMGVSLKRSVSPSVAAATATARPGQAVPTTEPAQSATASRSASSEGTQLPDTDAAVAALRWTTNSPRAAVSDGAAAEDVVAVAPRYAWEFFPSAQAEALVLRLDKVYEASLRDAWRRWQHWGVQLLRPPVLPPRAAGSAGDGWEGGVGGGLRSGTRGGDVLLALLSSSAAGDSVLGPAVPEWQRREGALWEGLRRWMGAVQAACDMPAFSLLLPPCTQLEPHPAMAPPTVLSPAYAPAPAPEHAPLPRQQVSPPPPPPPSSLPPVSPPPSTRRQIGFIGRKKGLAMLRRLCGGQDTPTNVYIAAERVFVQQHSCDEHRMWLVEPSEVEAAAAAAALDDDGASEHASSRCGAGSGAGSAARAEARWTIVQRPEVILADMRDKHDERVVTMYLQQVCVLQRSGGGVPATLRQDTSTDEQGGGALRLLRFAHPPARGEAGGDAHESPASFGVLEELPPHSPQRHAHAGCRVTPLACDEWVLGVAWPAEAIVDYTLLPPLAEALQVYCAKLCATLQPLTCKGSGVHVGDEGSAVHVDPMRLSRPSFISVPSAQARATMLDDLRRELLLVLTDERAMEQREFYGDGLLDYCVAVTALSYRHAASNFSTWRGGNITESSTNSALVVRSLPHVLREYWMARRHICNDKRLADCVESLFGAVAMAVWVLPLRRLRRHMGSRGCAASVSAPLGVRGGEGGGKSSEGGVLGSQDTPHPDADMLVYIASALLELLSGGGGGA